MATLKYLSSFDELTWRVDPAKAWAVRVTIQWSVRSEIRQWIESSCDETVWVWNGTSRPESGSVNWENLLQPHDSIAYLIFSHPWDAEMFMLKYTKDFSVKYYGNDILKAWHDSRS